MDTLYQKLYEHWEEVTDLPPQTLGPLTPIYKAVTRRLKVMPWPWFIIVSIGVVTFLLALLGTTITYLVTLLQRGF